MNGYIELIGNAATGTGVSVSLTGAKGFNNGVGLLNDMCRLFFSSGPTDKENPIDDVYAEARSFNVDDLIGGAGGHVAKESSKTPTTSGNQYVPDAVAHYTGLFSGKYSLSKVTGYTGEWSNSEQQTYLRTTYSEIGKCAGGGYANTQRNSADDFSSTAHFKVICKRVSDYSIHDYWIATRNIRVSSTTSTSPTLYFGLMFFNYSDTSGSYLVQTKQLMSSASQTQSKQTCYLRPIVKLNLNYVIFGSGGNGTKTTPWKLSYID